MKKTIFCLFLATAALSLSAANQPGTSRDANHQATENYEASQIEGRLNVDIDRSTKVVNFVRDNNDPFVLTKVYELKKANPYAVRGYLLSMTRGRQISSSPVQVDALKYNDGTGLLLVSAEDYRFSDSEQGEGFDSLIAKLDTDNLAFGNNRTPYIYFPKISPAANLQDMLTKVGASSQDSEFANGADLLMVDGDLNALVVSGTEWSKKHIMGLLEQYDKPIPEARISYKVLEIYAENDDKVGMDYQSWKNNDGVDLASAGGRYRTNWGSFFTSGVTQNGSNSTDYYNFNPKWSTRYLDFLTSIGRAKLLASGTLLAQNRSQASVSIDSGFFYDLNDAQIDENGNVVADYTTPNVDVIPRQQLTKMLPENLLKSLDPYMSQNTYVDLSGNAQAKYKDNYWRVLYQLAGASQYTDLRDLAGAATTITNGNQLAVVELLNQIYSNTNSATNNATAGVIHGKLQIMQPKTGFTFDLTVTPVVTAKAAQFDINMESVSLIGWNSDGTPRSSKSQVESNVQVAYSGQQFVIGGLKKVESIRSVSGLPFLKDLPFIGWLFSAESESIKRSQLVLIATVEYSLPDDQISTKITENIGKIVDSVERAENSLVDNLGFQKLHRRDYQIEELDNSDKSWLEDFGFRKRK